MRAHIGRPTITLTSYLTCLFLAAASCGCVKRPDAGAGAEGASDAPKPEVSPEPERRKDLIATKIPLPDEGIVERASGAYIVICHADAPKMRPGTTRTRDDALALARKTLERVKEPGGSFEAIAREVSEGPDARTNGGRLGTHHKDRIEPQLREIVQPLFRMKVGEVSEVLDTSQGFVIVQRLPIVEYAAAQVYIPHKESQGAGHAVTRDPGEAQLLAEKARDEARAPGARFEDVVEKHSDDYERLKKLGGFMGIFSRRDLGGREQEGLGRALFALEVGEVSDVVQTPYGFHVLKRIPAEPYRVTVSQILVRYRGSLNAKPGLARTKEEARTLAAGLLKQILEGKDFRELARESSDHPSSRDGGYTGQVMKGFCPPPFEEAAFSLEPGEVSVVIETAEGFHIIWRLE